MSEPYLGEIRMFGGNFAPAGWAFCAGQLLPISENEALFQLVGTTYGGDGESSFGVPDLRGRIPIHAGQGPGISQNYQLGETGGIESVTLTVSQIPNHTHTLIGNSDIATDPTPTNDLLSTSSLLTPYVGIAPDAALAANAISTSGGSQSHDNMMPFLCVSFIISLFGVFPSQT
jgi:microcystin-dependent protein